MGEKCVLSILELNWNQRLGHEETELNICHHMLTMSTQLQNRSFHVVGKTRTSSKCQKMKSVRGKGAKILFFIVKYANLWGFCCRRRRGCLSSLMTATKTSLENKHLGNADYFTIIASSSFIVDRASCNWTGRSAVEANIENERFTVVCWYIVAQALNLDILRFRLTGYVKELHENACRTGGTILFPRLSRRCLNSLCAMKLNQNQNLLCFSWITLKLRTFGLLLSQSEGHFLFILVPLFVF